jgi:CRP-like cAMP-binding protein
VTSAKEERVRRLRDEAVAAIEAGKFEAATTLYTQLAKLEPEEPAWLQRLADAHRRLGQKPLELAALLKAATAYRNSGFAIKAVALCKMAIAIDPANLTARKQLAELCAPKPSKRVSRPAGPRSRRPGKITQQASKADGAASQPSLPLSSASLIPKLPKTRQERVSLGVYELVLGKPKTAQLAEVKIHFKGPPKARIAQTLGRTPLFGEVDANTLPTLVDRIELIQVDKGQVLFREGDPADALYVVADGEMAAFRRGVQLGHLGEGDFFGEIGLISDQPRQATVGATRNSVLLKLNRALINELIETRPGFLKVVLRFLRARLVRTLMLTSPLFAKLGPVEQKTVSGQFKFLEIEPGTTLIEQGSKTQGLFILLEGKAVVRRETNGQIREIAQLQSGDLFGEMSLLSQKPANASVHIESRCFALFLSARKFHQFVVSNPLMLEAVSNIAHEREVLLQALGCPDGRADLIWVKPVRSQVRLPR